jgi:hypothetical protein
MRNFAMQIETMFPRRADERWDAVTLKASKWLIDYSTNNDLHINIHSTGHKREKLTPIQQHLGFRKSKSLKKKDTR